MKNTLSIKAYPLTSIVIRITLLICIFLVLLFKFHHNVFFSFGVAAVVYAFWRIFSFCVRLTGNYIVGLVLGIIIILFITSSYIYKFIPISSSVFGLLLVLVTFCLLINDMVVLFKYFLSKKIPIYEKK